MSWWTDTRDGILQEVGLGSPSAVATTAVREARNAIGDNGVKQELPQVQQNPMEAAARGLRSLGNVGIAGISIPVALLIIGGAYFIFKK